MSDWAGEVVEGEEEKTTGEERRGGVVWRGEERRGQPQGLANEIT